MRVRNLKIQMRDLLLIVGIVGLAGTITLILTEKSPSTYNGSLRSVLLNETFNVERNTVFFFEIKLKEGETIKGYFSVEGRVCINFYLLDKENFAKMSANKNYLSLISAIHVTKYEFSFTPEKQGTYYFVFDNKRLIEGEICKDKTIIFTVIREAA